MKIETEHHLNNFDNLSIVANNLDLSFTACDEQGLMIQLNDTSFEEIVFDELTLEQSISIRNFMIKSYPLSFKSYLLSQLDRINFKKWF